MKNLLNQIIGKKFRLHRVRIAAIFILICVMATCGLAIESAQEQKTQQVPADVNENVNKMLSLAGQIASKSIQLQRMKVQKSPQEEIEKVENEIEEIKVQMNSLGEKLGENAELASRQLAEKILSKLQEFSEKYGLPISEEIIEQFKEAIQDVLEAIEVETDSNDKTPLHFAAMNNHIDTAEMLISKGANVNAKDFDGNTPLHLAASGGNPEMCKLLIEKGAEVNAKNTEGRTPLDLAAAGGHRQTAELLIDKGAAVSSKCLKNEDILNKDYIPETSTINEQGRIVDKIDYPFEGDPQIIGIWKSIDFVNEIGDFVPGQRQWKVGELYLKELVFLPEGKTFKPWLTWTNGLIFHAGDKTASKYVIKELNGGSYMFFEWKSGDYTIRAMKPKYYVLKKMPQEKDADEKLPADLKAFDEWSMRNFKKFLDCGQYESDEDDLINQLNGGKSEEYYRAINALACMRSEKAVPSLAAVSFSKQEKDNRNRWMAVRALGLIGDKAVIGDLIHLLYHPNSNTRLYARISLIRITDKDLGPDWKKWALWYKRKVDDDFSTRRIKWTDNKEWADEKLQRKKDSEWLKKLQDEQEIKNKYQQ